MLRLLSSREVVSMSEGDKERITLDLSDENEDEYVPDEEDMKWVRKYVRTRWWED